MFADHNFDFISPILLQFNRAEIEDTRLIWGKDNLDRVDVVSRVRVDLLWTILNESASETVHDAMLSVTLFTEAQKVLTHNTGPMLFETISSSFKEARTFKFNFSLGSSRIATEIINDHLSI